MGSLIDHIRPPGPVLLDTAPLIYFIEQHPAYEPLVRPVMDAIDRGAVTGLCSVITLAEVLVRPLQQQAHMLAQQYRHLLRSAPNLKLVEITPSIAERAAGYRAAFGFKLPDALQLAAAAEHQAQAFVTNDQRLRSFDEVPVLILEDFLPGRLF